MSLILQQVGSKIRSYRKAKGFTQDELAEKSGLHHSYIGGVERGDRNISLETLEKIIFALDISAVDLFQIDNLDDIANSNDKTTLLEAHKQLLSNIGTHEIKLIHKIAKEILETYSLKKK